MPEQPRAPAGTPAGGQFMSYDSAKGSGTGYGEKGGNAKVKQLQALLNALGFTDGNGKKLEVDGMLGPLTTQSIKKAQSKLGLKADGKAGPELIAKLKASKGGKVSIGGSKSSNKKGSVGGSKSSKTAPSTKGIGRSKQTSKTPSKAPEKSMRATRVGQATTSRTKENRMKVTHGDGRIVESVGEDEVGGRVYRVRVIKYGDSKNRRRYPENVMRESFRLYEGAKAYDHHRDDAELRSSTVAGLVGWYENVEAGTDGLYADLHLLPSAKNVAEAMDATLAMQERGLPPLIGTSHDVAGSFRPVHVGGRVIQEATAITSVASVDIVANPAAGGQAVRAVAGGEDGEGDDMTREEILAMLADASDEELSAAGLARAGEADETENDENEENVTEATDPTFAKNSAVGRLAIKALLDDAKLPETVRESLTEALPERFTEADIESEIKKLKSVYASLERGGLVPAAAPGEGVAKESFEKKRDALDNFFKGNFQEGYWSFRQAYMDWTGNTPRSFTEDFNRRILRESIGSYDSADRRATEAMDTTSWNVALGDSITRRMIAEYKLPSLSNWRTIVSQVTPINDFRTQRIDRIGGYGTLPAVNQGAPYQPLTSPTDEEVTYAITKRGGTEEITLEMIANDDVRSVSRIPAKLGRAAAQTLYRFVWELVNPTTNPAIYDGDTLYHSNHANTDTNAFSQAAVSTGRQKMRDQAAYNNTDEILSLVPKILVVPNELEEHAWEVVTSTVAMPSGAPVGAASDVPNLHQGMQLIVMDYWTDATAWIMIADPNEIPTIEMGFYQGRETPELFTQSDPTVGSMFDADKLTYKIRHIYSGTVLDYRGFYRGNT